MNKYTMYEPLSYDDVVYTRSVLKEFMFNYITFQDFLEVAPAELNLAKLIVLAKNILDEESCIKLAELVINHYYSRLKEVKNYTEEKFLKKLLTTKEVFFLTDADGIERIIEDSNFDLAEEIRVAFNPIRDKIQPLLKSKVLGNSCFKLVTMIKPYNSIFNREKFLRNTPGIISPDGKISYVTDAMIDKAENFQSENELFPARVPTEKYLFNLCRKESSEDSEIEK